MQTKRQLAGMKLRDMLRDLADVAYAAGQGDEMALRHLKSICTSRQYVGPQIEIGRDELAAIMEGDDDDDEAGVPLADLAAETD